MDDQTPWEEIGGKLPAKRESSLPAERSSAAALEARRRDVHDLVPVSRDEFFSAVGPCLTLAAGVGMSQSDQDAWLEAAYQALDGIPISLLARGAQAAMQKADHPSKIVPAIVAEIGESWRWRKEHRPGRAAPASTVVPQERRIEPPRQMRDPSRPRPTEAEIIAYAKKANAARERKPVV